jgi:hypothetical protein
MRTWYPALVAATIVVAAWCLLIASVLPMGPVDGLYVHLRPRLVQLAGDDEARRLMAYLSREISAAIRTAVLLTSVPLLVTNVAWGCLAYRLLRKTGDLP